ncbi:uncharacterized protein [Amphiura filiformis]|uniref:uncharacterized protein isoform X2 n=1 Tax=Amphiura filiformis TaxID=82378 RepID=UPI003B222243
MMMRWLLFVCLVYLCSLVPTYANRSDYSSLSTRMRQFLGGPAGKRSNDDLKNFMGFLSDTTEDKQDTRPADYQNQKDFLQTDKTCWLDTAYSRLSPEWQEVVYKILTMAESKRS